MCGQFSAQQLGVAPRDENTQLCSEQTVHKEVPPIHILYLVQHQIGNVSSIELIHTGEHRIQVAHFHIGQTVVVEVDIAVSDAPFQQHLVAQRGFPTPTHTNHHLSHHGIELEERFLLARHPFLRFVSFDLLLLLSQYLKNDFFVYHNRIIFGCKDTNKN